MELIQELPVLVDWGDKIQFNNYMKIYQNNKRILNNLSINPNHYEDKIGLMKKVLNYTIRNIEKKKENID